MRIFTFIMNGRAACECDEKWEGDGDGDGECSQLVGQLKSSNLVAKSVSKIMTFFTAARCTWKALTVIGRRKKMGGKFHWKLLQNMTEIVQQRHDCGYKSYVAGYIE